MDQERDPRVNEPQIPKPESIAPPRLISRREALKYGIAGLACVSCSVTGCTATGSASTVFKGDAPRGKLWELWKKRGWVKEARHYLKLGANIECKLCPNECVLQPEDRGRCRNRVYKDGKLYTMAYGNPLSFGVDPIEKKPLFHFIPKSGAYSIATSGCGFRCLNCQNWNISQRKPEERKDPRGEPLRLTHRRLHSLSDGDVDRMSMFPEDVVALAEYEGSASIAYTYSEPTAWYEYMVDTAKAAREKKIKNVWVTCGYIREEPLVELCEVIDAANVDLKSFDEKIYADLNSGKLEPILNTLKTLKREGVWFEVTNLVVPTYTDKPEMIRRMCDWLVDSLGPDYPLHFSRFHPKHKLTHLPPTPIKMLDNARAIARDAGLHYVYVGNCTEVESAGTTFCPGCKKPLVERYVYATEIIALDLDAGKCKSCGTEIAGVWA